MAVTVSTPFPLVLPVTAVALGLRYVTERIYFVKVYKKPPVYDAKLVDTFLAMLPIALAAKIFTMSHFYEESQAGDSGALALFCLLLVWLTAKLPTSLASNVFAAALVWKSSAADADSKSDLGSTVTHQVSTHEHHMSTHEHT